MSEKPTISQMQHQWSYVVIPVGSDFAPLYTAHCRVCKAYYTKLLTWNSDTTGFLAATNLPEWGCIQPIGV